MQLPHVLFPSRACGPTLGHQDWPDGTQDWPGFHFRVIEACTQNDLNNEWLENLLQKLSDKLVQIHWLFNSYYLESPLTAKVHSGGGAVSFFTKAWSQLCCHTRKVFSSPTHTSVCCADGRMLRLTKAEWVSVAQSNVSPPGAFSFQGESFQNMLSMLPELK